MKGGRALSRTRLATVLILVVALLMIAAPAFAAGVEIAVGAPGRVTVGQDVVVKAVLSQDGVPVDGAKVALTYQASIAGELGRVELATATTDSAGIALMVYQQRADDNGEMQIVYVDPDGEAAVSYTFEIAVEPGGQQLYHQESGVRIPFVNGTLVIAIISGVWFLIALAAIYLVLVGLAGHSPKEASTQDGSIWIGMLLALAAVITAVGMVVVFIRAPVANTHITDPEGYDRTIVNYLDVTYPYEGFGLSDELAGQTADPATDGSLLYFRFACGACHGLTGQGAVVGPALIGEVGSFGSFGKHVREGPSGMPSYDSSTISDENVEKIYAYLEDGG